MTYDYIFSQFPNSKADAGRLADEIAASTITIALDTVDVDTACHITFKTDLSIEEKTLLDTIVSNHSGEPLTDIEDPKDLAGKTWVHESSRPFGTKTYFTGISDDMSNPMNVGNGDVFAFDHKIGDPMIETYYFDFNCLTQIVEMHEAYLIWEQCLFDQISLSLVPRVVETEVATNTFYNIYNNYLVIPAAGDGTVNITTDITEYTGGLVEMPMNELGTRPSAYWNADFNTTTNKFENITPAPNADGVYNIFSYEVILAKFVNTIPLLGGGFQMMQTADSEPIGHNMRMKLTCETIGADHSWQSALMATLHRSHLA